MAHPAQQFAVPISAERGGIFIMGQATLSRWVRTGMSSSRQDLSVRASQPLVRRSPWCGARGRVDDEPVAHLLRPGHRVAELEIQHARLTLETRRALCQRLRRADDEQFPSHLSGKSPPTCRSYERKSHLESRRPHSEGPRSTQQRQQSENGVRRQVLMVRDQETARMDD